MSQYADLFVSRDIDRLSGLTVLKRVDLNVPGQVTVTSTASTQTTTTATQTTPTVKLSERNLRVVEVARHLDKDTKKGLKVILCTHYATPGDPEYLENLEQLAQALNKLTVNTEVVYSNSLGGEETEKAVRSLKEGQALLLKNTRSDPDEKRKFASLEEQRKCAMVQRLVKLADFFENDAPASMHRGHTSLVGPIGSLPYYLGRQMEEELGTIYEMKNELESGRRVVLIIGGSKFEKIENIHPILARNKNVIALCGGVPGQTVTCVNFKEHFNQENLEFIQSTGGLETAEKLLHDFPGRIISPTDFLLDTQEEVKIEDLSTKKGNIISIGEESLNLFFAEMERADTIISAGPVDRYELEGCNKTLRILNRALSQKSHLFVPGGNSSDSIDNIGLGEVYQKLGGRRMTAGGAALEILAGKEPVALKITREAKALVRQL